MATPDERMQILKMVEAKQITAEEGAKLLQRLEKKTAATGQCLNPPPAPRANGFVVRVTDLKTPPAQSQRQHPAGIGGRPA